MQPSKKAPAKSVETHVYMTPAMKAKIRRVAKRNCRSVTGQIQHYLERALADDEALVREMEER